LDSTFTDFLRQVPIGFLLAPLFFGALWVVTMVWFLRRGAARRRARALVKGGTMPLQAQVSNTASAPLSFLPNLFAGRMSRQSLFSETAQNLPEPDLESLASISPQVALLDAQPDFVPDIANTLTPVPDWFDMPQPSAELVDPNALEPVSPEMKELSVTPSKLSDPAGAVEVMRVWRDLSDGSLLIELDGQRFRAPREISSAELARRFINVVRELWTMVNTGVPSRISPSGSTADLGAGTTATTSVGRQPTSPAYVPPETPAIQAPGMLRAFGRPAASQPESRPAGIADAVENYLQFKLSNTPQFQQRSIHVRPAFDGGVRIEVDGRSYNGVGDVVDPDVRDFLTTTLHEWEARQ
jgi:hypothetical protein